MAEVLGALGSMLSLIVVTLLGYVAARMGFLTADIRPKLSGLIFNVTLPCTVLASVGRVDSSLGATDITWSFVLGAAIFFVMLAASAVANAVMCTPRAERPLFLFMGVLTNTGFIGFAVLDSIFGGASVFLGSIFIAVSNVFLYSIGVGLLRSGGKDGHRGQGLSRARLADMARDMINAPLVASLVAMVIFFSGAALPGPLAQGISMAGNVTSPLAMMLVGLSLADADLRQVLGQGRLWGFTVIRFLVAPLAVYAVLAPLVPSSLALGVFTVLLAMPTGSMAGPIAATYGRDGELPARGTIVATLASFAIVPVIMVVMSML